MALEQCPPFTLSPETLKQLQACDDDASRFAAMRKSFSLLSGREPHHLAKAGGRVNLIGEHVDYPDLQFKGTGQHENEGASHLFSMGGSIQNSYLVALSPRQDQQVRVWHLNASEGFSIQLDDLARLETASVEERNLRKPMKDRSVPPWAFHTLGGLMERHAALPLTYGYDIALTSNVPHGAGMSNSAANCVALAITLQAEAPQLKLNKPMDIVAFARRSENSKFVGGHCGWLDQMLIVLSSTGRMTKIDYAGYQTEHFDTNFPGHWQFAALNTNVPHVLAESEYGDRVQELELGIQLLRKVTQQSNFGSPTPTLAYYNLVLSQLGEGPVSLDGIDDEGQDPQLAPEALIKACLQHYNVPELPRHKGLRSSASLAIILKRMRHQKSSSLIVPAAGTAATQGDAMTFGQLLSAEGQSLRMSGDFQITGDNGAQDHLLDCGFDAAKELDLHVFGRMLGGGGGGNVLFMVDRHDEARYQSWVRLTQTRYHHWSQEAHGPGIEATLIEPVISEGAHLVKTKS